MEIKNVKATGMTRPVDSLGRIVLPAELRRTLNISTRDYLEISVSGPQIILSKAETLCTFCGSSEDLIDFNGKYICRSCTNAVSEAAK